MDDVNKYTDDNPLKLIIGNKCDLEANRQVTNKDIQALRESTGIEVIEASAKMSIKINDIMEVMTRKLIQKKKSEASNKNNTNKGVNLNDKNASNITNGCC